MADERGISIALKRVVQTICIHALNDIPGGAYDLGAPQKRNRRLPPRRRIVPPRRRLFCRRPPRPCPERTPEAQAPRRRACGRGPPAVAKRPRPPRQIPRPQRRLGAKRPGASRHCAVELHGQTACAFSSTHQAGRSKSALPRRFLRGNLPRVTVRRSTRLFGKYDRSSKNEESRGVAASIFVF